MGTKQLIITITVALSQGQGILWENGEKEEDEGELVYSRESHQHLGVFFSRGDPSTVIANTMVKIQQDRS